MCLCASICQICVFVEGCDFRIAPPAQSVSALDFNFERAIEGSILTAGQKVESEKSECNNLGYKLTDLTWWP